MDPDARSAWLLVAVAAVAVFAASVAPPALLVTGDTSPDELGGKSPGGSPLGVPTDKLWHAAIYAALAAVTVRATTRSPRFRRPIAVAGAATVSYGLAIEAVQSQLAWRTGDPLDAVANAVGIGLASMAVLATRAVERRSREGPS